MRLSYDPRRNVAYLRLRAVAGEVETMRASDDVNIDFGPDGSVTGIELLNANEQLRAGDDGQFVFADDAHGQETKLPLPAMGG